MERFTEKRDGQSVIPLHQYGNIKWAVCSAGMGEASSQFLYGDHANRLYAYEETELTPEEVAELAKAKKDGRLVVTPCKKGDKVFILTHDSTTGIEETKCKKIELATREDGLCAKVIAPCKYDDWGGAYRELWPEDFGKTVFLKFADAKAALSGGAVHD